jgi:hypothetical protein
MVLYAQESSDITADVKKELGIWFPCIPIQPLRQ